MSTVSNVHIFDSKSNTYPQQTNIVTASVTTNEHNKIQIKTNNLLEISPYINNKLTDILNNGDFGVWIHTKYNGIANSTKLNIDLVQFSLMLNSLAWSYYDIGLEKQGDTRVGIQFSRTQIYVNGESDPYVDVFQTQFDFTTACETDKEVEVSYEVRFPFSSISKTSISESLEYDSPKSIIFHKLEKIAMALSERTNNKVFEILSKILLSNYLFTNEKDVNTQSMLINSESYFCIRTGFASPEGDRLPGKVLTRFFSGRDKLFDPRVVRIGITPDVNGESSLTYFNSYLTVDEFGKEAFSRTFSIEFEPAVELQITSILRELKIRYDFGRGAGVSTRISLNAFGGALSGIVQHFIINPLPEYMSFDLTVLGERSFKYEAEQQYSVTYTADSTQNGNLVKIDLKNLPLRMSVEWGLGISLGAMGSGLLDLDMSSDIDEVSLSLFGSTTPFIRVTNFPKKIRLEGFIDVLNLQGYVRASKVSDTTTTISVPIQFDKWLITGNLRMFNGYGQISFDLPGKDGPQVSVGLDTGNNAMFGLDLTVVDTQTSNQVLFAGVDAIATDNYLLSFDGSGGGIAGLKFSGTITEMTNLQIKIDYQGLNFEIAGTWVLGQEGSFLIEVSKTVNLALDNINAGNFALNGKLLVNPGGYVKVEWKRGDIGCFIFSTHGISADVEVTFGDKYSSNAYFYGKVKLASGAIVKYTWDWSANGYFMVFCNLFEELDVEAYINYDSAVQQYQYGFNAFATDIMFTRTLKWDIANLRFWWLGDEPLPGQWDVWILWNYEWHEVL